MPTDLWSFALACYARPGVEPICLRLQDDGADICLLLCALWLEQRGAVVSTQRMGQLQATARPWQQTVVQPLRELRRNWKDAALSDSTLAHWREQIKGLELAAERELLARLEQQASSWPVAEQAGDWLELLIEDRDARNALRAAANGS